MRASAPAQVERRVDVVARRVALTMPRPRILPIDDALLSAGEACVLVHVSRSRWDAYAKRYRALTRGRRVVQANPGGRGVYRWLKSALIEHMHVELANDRDPTSDLVETAEIEADDEVAP